MKAGGAPDNFDIIKYKYTILSKQIYSDSVSYTAKELYSDYNYNSSSVQITTSEYNTTLTYVDSITHFANTFLGQFVSIAYKFSSLASSTYSNLCNVARASKQFVLLPIAFI